MRFGYLGNIEKSLHTFYGQCTFFAHFLMRCATTGRRICKGRLFFCDMVIVSEVRMWIMEGGETGRNIRFEDEIVE